MTRPVESRRSERAFTMIEIAIAIGVIGFALVAVIGILPRGMNVQKDNREDTIISQDAPYLINAIRNGEMRTVNGIFTNSIETIVISNNGGWFTNYNAALVSGAVNSNLNSDMAVVGILGTPYYDFRVTDPNGPVTNLVIATMRAMSGSAVTQNGPAASTMAFKYQVTVENVPWISIAYDSTNWNNPAYLPTNSYDYTTRYNRWLAANSGLLASGLHDLRLKFAWPVFPNGSVGPNRQVYRTQIGSHLLKTNVNGLTMWFFQPQSYTTNISQSN